MLVEISVEYLTIVNMKMDKLVPSKEKGMIEAYFERPGLFHILLDRIGLDMD